MHAKHFWTGLISCAVFLAANAVRADDARVEQLEHQIRERDKVILELLERVEALERRVGVPRRTTEADQVGEAPAAVSDAPPGTVVVEEGAAERALERSLTREGALLLPSGILEVEPSLSYARQEDSTPSFVTSGGLLFSGETERNVNSLTADLALRLGAPWDSQVEVGLPYRLREVETVTSVNFAPTGTSSPSGAGLSDLRVGVAKTLLREGLWRPDLVGRITWDSDTGRATDNGVSLGGGFHELRGSLSAIKRQDPIAFVSGLSFQHAFESGEVRRGWTAAANFGGFIALSPETSLRLVLSGAYQDETEVAGNKIGGTDRTIGSFVVGGSTLIAPGTLLNLSAGIGLTDDADDFSIALSLPIRFSGPIY